MSTTMSVLFYGGNQWANNKDEYSIYIRITIAGERYEVGTRRFILEENWSKDTV